MSKIIEVIVDSIFVLSLLCGAAAVGIIGAYGILNGYKNLGYLIVPSFFIAYIFSKYYFYFISKYFSII